MRDVDEIYNFLLSPLLLNFVSLIKFFSHLINKFKFWQFFRLQIHDFLICKNLVVFFMAKSYIFQQRPILSKKKILTFI